ncbi:uncharacterized protein LOC144611973 [Rhinoraja longicauda]
MAALLRKANPRNPAPVAPRNASLAHKARSVKLTEANKENCPEPVRPEKGATKQGSGLPVPMKKFTVKSVPDFKKLHQNWDRNFQKKQTASKKACTRPVPFNFATSRGAKSTEPMSTKQAICEDTIELSSAVTEEGSSESEESYPVGGNCAMADRVAAAGETILIPDRRSGELPLQEKQDFDPSISSLKIDWSVATKKEKQFDPCQTSSTPIKTKNSDVQTPTREIKPPSMVKGKMEIPQNMTMTPKAGNSNGDFVGNPMALQSILSNVGIDAFSIINDKPSLANGVSVKKNIQNPEQFNLNPGNNKGMALGNASSTVDGRNTFSILCGKTSMISQAPAKNSALRCKYPAQNPFMIGRSSYMPCNRPALPFALGRASCIAKLDTMASEITTPNRILQPLRLYNEVSNRHHFSTKTPAKHKPDGPDANLVEEPSESSSCAASTSVSARFSCTWKPHAKTMQTPDRALRPSNCPFSSTRTPCENAWHPSRMLAPPCSMGATYKYVKWSDVCLAKGKATESSASDNVKDSMDQIVLRLFNDPDDQNEVEKVPEMPSLKQELEGAKSQESPVLMDLKLEKLKKIELLAQLLQKEIQEVKVIEETLTENNSDESVPLLAEGFPKLAGAILQSCPIATASKQAEAEGCLLLSECTELVSNQTSTPVDCSGNIDGVSGAVKDLCTDTRQSEMLLPSTEPLLNLTDTLPTPASCSLLTSAHLLTAGVKFQSPYSSGQAGRGALHLSSVKQRFGELRPGCRKRFQETLLDEEVSCCFARIALSPDRRGDRNCTNPVAKILEQQEVMHFVPIELPPCISSQRDLQQFLLSVWEEQESPAL